MRSWGQLIGFEVFSAVSTKMAVFRQKFTNVSEVLVVPIIRAIALMMEAARTSKTLVNFYQTTRRFNPEDSHLGDSCLRPLTVIVVWEGKRQSTGGLSPRTLNLLVNYF
jgi:hypothetical protein